MGWRYQIGTREQTVLHALSYGSHSCHLPFCAELVGVAVMVVTGVALIGLAPARE
jgi:hypothetical protein